MPDINMFLLSLIEDGFFSIEISLVCPILSFFQKNTIYDTILLRVHEQENLEFVYIL